MSDADQDWKPKGRPQSTMAQAFSTALDSVFELDSEVDHLSQTIDQKYDFSLSLRSPLNRKFQMIIQNRELEELQARIREAEKRLKARQSLLLNQSPVAQTEGEYQSTESTDSSTSPTDTAGQYSSGDEQRHQDRDRDRDRGQDQQSNS